MGEAIRHAMESLGVDEAAKPSFAAVRKHAQAMAMQAMGEAGYRQSRLAILRIAEELMTALEQVGCEAVLVGRAAAGHLDADAKLHLRLYTDASMADLAASVVEFGYEEPAFDTVETMYGRLSRMRFVEAGVPIVLTRCPPAIHIDRHVDAFAGKSIASMTVQELRRWIESAPGAA